MEDSKKGYLPMKHGIRLSKDRSPNTNEELERMSRVTYASDVGSIMYAMACTRSDISDARSMVIRCQ